MYHRGESSGDTFFLECQFWFYRCDGYTYTRTIKTEENERELSHWIDD